MLTAKELVQEGETLLGDFNVEVARWVNERWSPTMPSLYAVLTDHRLILQAQTRKRHEPAIIPGRYIKRVLETFDHYQRRVVIIHLKTGQQISLFTSRNQAGADFVRHLRTMSVPPSPIKFNPELELNSLQKIINYVEKL